VVCPVHEASYPGNCVSCLAKLPSGCVVVTTFDELLSDELLPLVRLASYKQVAVPSLLLLAGWQNCWRCFPQEVPLATGRFICFDVERERGSERVVSCVVRMLPTRSECQLVYGQRNESSEEKRD